MDTPGILQDTVSVSFSSCLSG